MQTNLMFCLINLLKKKKWISTWLWKQYVFPFSTPLHHNPLKEVFNEKAFKGGGEVEAGTDELETGVDNWDRQHVKKGRMDPELEHGARPGHPLK